MADIVGLSDPAMSTKTQIKKIETLNRSVMECSAFKGTPKEMILVLPTGDGLGANPAPLSGVSTHELQVHRGRGL